MHPEPAEGLITLVHAWERLIAYAAAKQADAVAGLIDHSAQPALPRGDLQPEDIAASELAVALRWTHTTSTDRVCLAQDLRAFPRVKDAMTAGELDLTQVRALLGSLECVSTELGGRIIDEVLDDATAMTSGQIRARVAKALIEADPEAAERRRQEKRRERKVACYPGRDGIGTLSATLSAEDAVACSDALDAMVRSERPSGDERTLDQRRADAFVACILGPRTDAGTDISQPRRPSAQVTVTVPLSALVGVDDAPGQLAGFGPIPAGLARELAGHEDSTWRRLVTDEISGGVLDVGRSSYRPPASLVRHLRLRDVTCRFPGCRKPAKRCDVDHQTPFPEGPTSAGNTGVLCRHHHRLKTMGGWRVRHLEDDSFLWTSPLGRRYLTRPHPYD